MNNEGKNNIHQNKHLTDYDGLIILPNVRLIRAADG